MIKFFRKVRQNLLMENKTGKYFKYAIGEIILVIIGILIALQINNWKNYKTERETEKIILHEIQANLEYDFNDFEEIHLIVSRPVQKEIDFQKNKSGRVGRKARAVATQFNEKGVSRNIF